MKTLMLTIKCEDNEMVAWVLRDTAEALEGGYLPSALYDDQGNRVGEVVVDMGKEA